MHVGTDIDGRTITYDEASNVFRIGGIESTIDRLMAYDRGGQVSWAAPEIRDWAVRYEAIRVEYLNEQQAAHAAAVAERAARTDEAVRKSGLTAKGYEPSSALALVTQLRGLSILIIAGFGLSSSLLGFSLGALMRGAALIIMPLVLGAAGLLVGYLATLALSATAHALSTLVQIEMNTRRDT